MMTYNTLGGLSLTMREITGASNHRIVLA
jgi:hypothetical protein